MMGHVTKYAGSVRPREAKSSSADAVHTSKRRVYFFVGASTVICIFLSYAFYLVQAESSRAKAQEIVSLQVAQAKGRIEAYFAGAVTDLVFLANHPFLYGLIARNADAESLLAEEFAALAESRRAYDQIRYLRADGMEAIRVNWRDGGAEIVPGEQLQPKSDRYYVKETLRSPRGSIYVSKFDLNVERGVVERPFKPVIRLSAPVHDDAGALRGAVVLNYLGANIIDEAKFGASSTQGEIWLVNGDGHWLAGPDPEAEWTFMFDDRPHTGFADAYPEAWSAIRDGSVAEVSSGDRVFIVGRIEPSVETLAPAPAWPTLTLVGHVSDEALAGEIGRAKRNAVLAFFALAAMTAAGGYAAAVLEEKRREAQARRESAEEALRESERRQKTILDSIPDGVVVVDENGLIERINHQLASLFLYSREELLGRPIEVLLPERSRAAHVSRRDGYKADPRIRTMGAGMELFGLKKDGVELPVAVSLSPVELDNGRKTIASVRDVTAQRATESHIRRLNARLTRDKNELEVVNRELEAFSASVSHDLRSPLRAIDGFSNALLEDYADKLDEEGRGYLNRVRSGAQRMGHLIDDMLHLSRITRLEMAVDDVDLTDVARQVAAELREAEPGRDVDFVIADGLHAKADRRLVTVALQNLIGNAFKFTGKRPSARIEVGAEHGDAGTVFHVRDNGAGFDMKYDAQLFNAFKRLHDAREFPGTGVGLATVQRVIHKHGGRIWAEAAVDQGACFFFTLEPERGRVA